MNPSKSTTMKKLILMMLLVLNTLFFFAQSNNGLTENEKTAWQLAQNQLDAYNARDIEAFLINYSDTVKIYNFPNQLVSEGLDNMRKGYADMFANTPDLHCKLVNRMVQGNTVIDQEAVIFRKNEPPLKAIAIYKIENNKIQEVFFIQ
jgi:hypothetical protein